LAFLILFCNPEQIYTGHKLPKHMNAIHILVLTGCPVALPNVIVPRQRLETLSPDFPRKLYSTLQSDVIVEELQPSKICWGRVTALILLVTYFFHW